MILNVEMYNNHIRQTKELHLSSSQLEETVKHYQYKGEKRIVDEQVENMFLPPIALVFYSLLYDTDNVPSPDDLLKAYFNQPYFSFVADGKVNVTYEDNATLCNTESITARVLRTYPSLLRDLHFYLLANESNCFDAVRYSFKKDYEGKIDVQILHNGKWYNVGLLLNSKRSLFYKFKKQFRHKQTDVLYVELDKSDCKMCGDYMLYAEHHIKQLYEKVEKFNK